MAIPVQLIQPLRNALVSQGFSAQTINNDGTINPAGLLAAAYDEVEFRSAATPPIILRTNELLQEGPPNPFIQWLKPTVVLRGKAGTNVIAPMGPAQGSWLPPLLGIGALVGLGYLLGRTSR